MDAYSISEPTPHAAADPTLVTVARFLPSTRAEGPGHRTAVWVQGCGVRCPGCFNPQMWSFRGGEQISLAELAGRILAAPTDGLTLLGGEPFDQAAGLAEVAAVVGRAGRSVMTFTGYTWAQLRRAVEAGRDDVAGLLAATDLLVAGPFEADRVDQRRPWVGSTNQEFLLLTDRFPHLLDDMPGTPDRVEVVVDTAGGISVNGWSELNALDDLLASLDRTHVRPRTSSRPAVGRGQDSL